MSKRLMYLEKVTSEGSKDPFAWYALANEYNSVGRPEDAIRTFESLRTLDPSYVPQYLICGQLLANLKRPDEAKVWLNQGLEVAQRVGNNHALSEITNVLATLE